MSTRKDGQRFKVGDWLIVADHDEVQFGQVIDRERNQYRVLYDGEERGYWCDDEDSMRHVHVDDSAIARAILSNVSIAGQRLTWQELCEQQRAEIERLQRFATMVNDLDRNEHGRHEGDADALDPTGVSQGNPHIKTGDVFAYNLSGRPYRMPERERRHEPDAWQEELPF